ncbi:hypothetical protein [Sphingobacterium paucimobilis]|uniref:Uncharacterized protein n=1 Tax=Sphingobacterium paucimobilis HER1398 TaxID=1346330 RepID=U2HTV4_9SPHI|nr:hypothetical protein [Sphingobacterium paucimobilis]ERJ58710.1 hypothetical protein M472_08010 [Sphingobacterium paucimobilis HER1398]
MTKSLDKDQAPGQDKRTKEKDIDYNEHLVHLRIWNKGIMRKLIKMLIKDSLEENGVEIHTNK